MTFFDDHSIEDFSNQPEEMNGQYDSQGNWISNVTPVPIHVQETVKPIPEDIVKNFVSAKDIEQKNEEEDLEEDSSAILNDARLRLEQGRLYELVMKHDIFEGIDADPKAIKNVQKEIRSYAQERMEIMLGMRRPEVPKEIVEVSMPFNQIEIDVLKAIAATATQGVSRNAEPVKPKEFVRTSLNPITSPPKKTETAKKITTKASPIKRSNPNIEKILEEEGLTLEEIDAVMNGTLGKGQKLTEEEIIKRNARIKNQKAVAKNTAPIPSFEEQMRLCSSVSNPTGTPKMRGWQELIEMTKVMQPTKLLNTNMQAANFNPTNYENKS